MLKKRNCLKGRKAFSLLFKVGKRVRGEHFTVYCASSARLAAEGLVPEEKTSFKAGFVVGKKCGKAHDRNRIKRRLRAAVREQFGDINPARLFIIRAAVGAGDLGFDTVRNEVRTLLDRSGILRK